MATSQLISDIISHSHSDGTIITFQIIVIIFHLSAFNSKKSDKYSEPISFVSGGVKSGSKDATESQDKLDETELQRYVCEY